MDKDLNKIISDALNNPPDFPIDEEKWLLLEQQLDLEEDKKPIAGTGMVKSIGWGFLYVLPFLLLSGYIFYYKHLSNNQIQELQAKISKLENEQKESSLFSEKVKNKTVHHYDTVYHIINRAKENVAFENRGIPRIIYLPYFNNDFYFQSQSPKNSFSSFSNNNYNSNWIDGKNSLSNYLRESISKESLQSSSNRNREDYSIRNVDLLASKSITELLLETEIPKLPLPFFNSNLKKKKRFDPGKKLRPKGFHLNANYTFLNPKIGHTTASSGYASGLLSELVYSKNLRMMIGLEYMELKYQIDDKNILNEKYPHVTPADPHDVLAYMKAKLQYLQIPFGMRYVMRPRFDFRPIVGIGAISRRPLKQNLSYEYLGVMQEYYVDRVFESSPFTLKTLSGSIGFEYDLSRNLSMTLMGTYYKDVRQNSYEFELLKMYGLQFGATVNF